MKPARSNKNTKSPSKPPIDVVCILSGQKERLSYVKAVKQAAKYKFENLDDYIKYYVSKDSVKELRQGYTEKQIQEKNEIVTPVRMPFNVLRLYVKKFKNRQKQEKLEKRKEVLKYIQDKNSAYYVKNTPPQYIDLKNSAQVAKLTESSCMRPDIYLNNDRACNGCYIYKLCKCPIRKWADEQTKQNKRKK